MARVSSQSALGKSIFYLFKIKDLQMFTNKNKNISGFFFCAQILCISK